MNPKLSSETPDEGLILVPPKSARLGTVRHGDQLSSFLGMVIKNRLLTLNHIKPVIYLNIIVPKNCWN